MTGSLRGYVRIILFGNVSEHYLDIWSSDFVYCDIIIENGAATIRYIK